MTIINQQRPGSIGASIAARRVFAYLEQFKGHCGSAEVFPDGMCKYIEPGGARSGLSGALGLIALDGPAFTVADVSRWMEAAH